MSQLFPPEIIMTYRCKTITKAAIIICTVIATFSFSSCYRTHNISSIDYGKSAFSFNKYGHILLDGDYFFDTGAMVTLLIQHDSLNMDNSKKTNFFQVVMDGSGKVKTEKLYFFENFSASDIQFNKAYFLMLSPETLSLTMQNAIQKGLIGMNFIKHANWLIDFKDSTIHCLSKDSIICIPENNVLILKYKNRYHPKIDLVIDNHKFKNLLFDTGLGGDLLLRKSDLSQIKKNEALTKEISYSSLYKSDSTKQTTYMFEKLNVNDFIFTDIEVTEYIKPMVGVSFVKRFNYLFIDTKNQVFYLYN